MATTRRSNDAPSTSSVPAVPEAQTSTQDQPPLDRKLLPSLSPQGRLSLVEHDDAPELEPQLAHRLRAAFSRSQGHGLLWLGAAELGQVLPPALAYWRDLGSRFVSMLCTQAPRFERDGSLPPPPDELGDWLSSAPLMPGAEYLSEELLRRLWSSLAEAFSTEYGTWVSEAPQASLQGFLHSLSPAWNLLGRVHLHLAENRKDAASPFAFLATYTHQISEYGKAQHLPLGKALREYAGADKREELLSLLLPVQRGAEHCTWLAQMVDSGELFHPLRFSPREAFLLLDDVPKLERAGIIVRMPAHWAGGRPARPRVTVTVGEKSPSLLGLDAMLAFRVQLTLDGEPLNDAEIQALLSGTQGLALIRGQWVELDPQRLERTLARYRKAEQLAANGGLSFVEAMRMLVGAKPGDDDGLSDDDRSWSQVTAGPWLAQTLEALRAPEQLAKLEPGRDLHATLRPYQEVGVRWLHLLSQLGLGACLADDMGLGKTIQVLALLLVLRREAEQATHTLDADAHRLDEKGKGKGKGTSKGKGKGKNAPAELATEVAATGGKTQREWLPSLLVAPASLLANWNAELQRFAPSLKAMIAHTSFMSAAEAKGIEASRLASLDLVITSYGALLRVPWLASTRWRLVILDEAQAIKNPNAKQTRTAKKLQAQARIALTGTPIENHLGELWSIFDFLNPGLLGSAKAFTTFTRKGLKEHAANPFGALRALVRPYILRRLKTDRRVISDLPDKTELNAFCLLSRKQAALYQQSVKELAELLENAEGIGRRGLVLAFLMRLKQICNHPSQWLGDGAWSEDDSGKWARLRELAEVIAAKQEKALVFTQFREMAGPLASFLGGIFGRPGLVLHGGTPVKKRKELVSRFQEDESLPFFVLSLKAGGSGLNLTAASHVIHFDRWWNPAVENQATDRAFRIGQQRNVLVHKFVCRGTIEERIDELIASKRQLSDELLRGGAEPILTEMPNDELLRWVALDLSAAMKE